MDSLRKVFRWHSPTTITDFSSVKVSNDSIVQFKAPLDDGALALITTLDGTIRPLFNKVSSTLLKSFVVDKAKAGNLQDPLQLLWDDLSLSEKYLLLKEAFRFNNTNFFKVRDQIKVTFKVRTYLLGRLFPAGTYDLPLGRFFDSLKFEMAQGADDLPIVEFHFWGSGTAGLKVRDANQMMKVLGVSRRLLQVHLVDLFPDHEELFDHEKSLGFSMRALEMTEFIRRVNVFMEMQDLVRYGSSLRERSEHVQSLKQENYLRVFGHLDNRFFGLDEKLGRELKLGWAALHADDSYKSQKNEPLWGIQIRTPGRYDSISEVEEVLNGIQRRMKDKTFVNSHENFLEWLKFGEPIQNAKQIAETYYDRLSWDEKALKQLVHSLLTGFEEADLGGQEIVERVLMLREEHPEVMILLHDWFKDSLLFNISAQKKKYIRGLQMTALRKISTSQKEASFHGRILGTVSSFLRKSNLYQIYSDALK